MEQLALFENKPGTPLTKAEIQSKLLDLYHRGKHSSDDVEFIREHYKNTYVGIYFVWKQHRKNNLYIGYMIYNNSCPRKAAMFKTIVIIDERKLASHEWEEMIGNYGCHNRVIIEWSYATLEKLIEDDLKYGVTTPVQKYEERLAKGDLRMKNPHIRLEKNEK